MQPQDVIIAMCGNFSATTFRILSGALVMLMVKAHSPHCVCTSIYVTFLVFMMAQFLGGAKTRLSIIYLFFF